MAEKKRPYKYRSRVPSFEPVTTSKQQKRLLYDIWAKMDEEHTVSEVLEEQHKRTLKTLLRKGLIDIIPPHQIIILTEAGLKDLGVSVGYDPETLQSCLVWSRDPYVCRPDDRLQMMEKYKYESKQYLQELLNHIDTQISCVKERRQEASPRVQARYDQMIQKYEKTIKEIEEKLNQHYIDDIINRDEISE